MKTSNRERPIACPDFADRLVDLSDGELAADDRIAVEAHLAGCQACRAQLTRLNASLAALQSAIVTVAPAQTRSNRRTSRVGPWVAVGGTAAAILLAVGIASLSEPPPVVQIDNLQPKPAAPLTTDDALRRIALLEQQARLETSLAHLPDDPWFADRRAANEQLLSTYREAATAIDRAPHSTPDSKETL